MVVRTLHLSREIWIFLLVTTCMSVVYLHMMTGENARRRAKVESITPTTLNAGQVIDAAITLISADAHRLACASDTKVGDAHCAFGADLKPWQSKEGDPPTRPENEIAPYMTVDNVLFLIPGLFTQPVLKKRLEDEPPGKYTRDELESRRFTVTCKLKLEQKFEKFKVRWDVGQPWGDRSDAWFGTVSDCKMTGG
ncbi:MAG: hypothetical protein RMJ98_20860 [Myxococcales bacterium]|nr:hypothetical protein [Myxococcales bacterium]